MKTTKKEFIYFEYTDTEALRQHLEEMALKGWQLHAFRNVVTRVVLEFYKAEPKKLRYNVEIVPKASTERSAVSANSQGYIDLCAEAGWTYVCNNTNVYVFVTEDENAPAVETDAAAKIEVMKKNAWGHFFALLIASSLLAGLMFSRNGYLQAYYHFSDFVASAFEFYCAVMALALFSSYGLTSLFFFKSAAKALEKGEPIPYMTLQQVRRRNIVFSIIFTMFILVILAGITLDVIQFIQTCF